MTQADLIDRYLNAVKLWLPKKQQKDILAELAEDLHSQIEERESVLGHPLEEAELVDLLKRRGSPMRVASGYIPEVRLINPAMLPLYWMVLRIVLLWVLAPIFALVFIGPLFDSQAPGKVLAAFFATAFQSLFFVIGIVTAVFALLDRYHSKWVDRWDPRKLPHAPRSHQQMQWYNDFSGFAFGMAATVFWAMMMWHRSAFVLSSGFRIILTPIWGQIYWLVVALTLERALVDLYCFVRPSWTPARSWVRLAFDALKVVIALLLLRVTSWVDIGGTDLSPADVAKTVGWLNGMIQVTLICAAAIMLFDGLRQGRLLWRAKNGRSRPVLTVS
jgi:hypothetical protein